MDPTSTAVCPVYTKSATRDRIDLCGIWKHQINTSAERPDDGVAWEDYEVPGWRGEYYASRGMQIDPAAAALLAEYAGTCIDTLVL